jgi:3-methyl-2-oxobutanoate hydroxymethyltransferase
LGFFSARFATYDPFVYRLGLQVFILARRVRLPYGSPYKQASALRGLFGLQDAPPLHFPQVTALQKAQALRLRKSGRPVAMLTAYDYPTARLLDESGVDALLVGDSLGMVVLGFPDTTHVTLEHMLHHVAAVARAKPRALVIGDLPIHTYDTPEQALETARRLVAAGAEAVKLEGGIRQAEKIRAITQAGIPVMGHLGMLPQRVIEEGGYHKKGKTPEQAEAIREGAQAIIEAGVFAIVFESIIPETARQLSAALSVPTIGIGCGNRTCDGEVSVVTDLLGSYPWFVPPFAKPEADVAAITRDAVAKYVSRVQS